MVQHCEVCGRPVHGRIVAVEIDGAVFKVCGGCSKLGRPAKVSEQRVEPAAPTFSVKSSYMLKEPEVELRRDFHMVVRVAREKMGLSQEQLGRKINEKLSVIKLIEGGKLKPDNMLARKIEHFLRVELLVPSESEI